jgi:hypothetical protein
LFVFFIHNYFLLSAAVSPNGLAQRLRRDRETLLILAPLLAKRACARAAKPLSAGAGVSRLFT